MATTATVVSEHPVTKGISQKTFATGGSLYKAKPLLRNTKVLLRGAAEGVEEDQPVAWSYQRKDGGMSFYTSLGHVKDFELPQFQLLLKQATHWLVKQKAEKKK